MEVPQNRSDVIPSPCTRNQAGSRVLYGLQPPDRNSEYRPIRVAGLDLRVLASCNVTGINCMALRSMTGDVVIYYGITSCRRAAATICPAPLLPPWEPKRLARPSRRQRSSNFSRPTPSHAHRCSCLTRQHRGEQSGLVTLTF